MLEGMIKGFFAAKQDKYKEWKYQDLETTPYLYGSEYLRELSDTKDHKEQVWDYMNRFNVNNERIDSYWDLTKDIEEDLKWR